VQEYGAPFVKILYLTDLAQNLLSLRRDSYLVGTVYGGLLSESLNHI